MPESGGVLMGAVLECAARTDIGLVRERNEDALWVDAEQGWLLLADGMGGHQAGSVASALAVSHVLDCLRTNASQKSNTDGAEMDRAALLATSVIHANTAIRNATCEMEGVDVMGSTFVGALLRPDEITYVYIGDSRLYVLRDGALMRLSHDHTVMQEFVDAGRITEDVAQNHPYRGLLTRGLGVHDEAEPDTGIYELRAGDRLLLCSDGLTDMVDEDCIASLLGASIRAEEIVENLIEAAKTNGGRDNISVIVAWFAA
ncbi:MAG: protein phosphatase 2C domain-containing protein [Azoarcus sp.]|nr:protein phosphatase 2C domain-containing protein [Azoarcus sp.]